MFQNEKRDEIGKITNIPIDFGVSLILSIEKNPNKTVIPEKKIENKRTGKITIFKNLVQYSNIRLHDWKITDKRKANQNTIDVLGTINTNELYQIELPKSLSNIFMDKIDQLQIEYQEQFSLEKLETDNEYQPELDIQKV